VSSDFSLSPLFTLFSTVWLNASHSDPDRELTTSGGGDSNKGASTAGGDDEEEDVDATAKSATKATSSSTSTSTAVDDSTLLRGGASGSAIYSQLTATELTSVHLSHRDLKRLDLYARNMVDHHMILDMLPTLSKLLFLGRIKGVRLSYLQVAILLATGLQHRYYLLSTIYICWDAVCNRVVTVRPSCIRLLFV
jgi:hypothetical protein